MTELERCKWMKKIGFTYNPKTGQLIGVFGNEITAKSRGYFICQFWRNSKKYNIYAHRLAWFLHYGRLPNNQIDHIDGCRTNNKIDNLRDVTNQQNQWNQTKAKGFSWNKQKEKFSARIKVNGKIKHLGFFNTEQEAHTAYLNAKKKRHNVLLNPTLNDAKLSLTSF